MLSDKWIEWSPAYDKRHEDPAKNYGIHGMELRAYLRGERAVMQFVLYTSWLLPHNADEHKDNAALCRPIPADVGYHAYEPVYEGQTGQNECHALGGAPCYYDGSGLQAYHVFDLFTTYGEEGLWWTLAWYYRHWVCDDDDLPELPHVGTGRWY